MIKIAVIGAGHWGPNLIRNFHNHRGSEVSWVVDRDLRRLEVLSQEYQGVRVSADPREAFSDAGVDAVAISTPTSTHYALAKAALEAGKHALVEKPLTTDVAQAEELCAIADTAGLVLMVGHVFLYNRAIRHVHGVLDRGELGRLFHMSMVRTNLGPIRGDVNAAWDLAAHDVSIANDWLGQPPVSASAVGGCWINSGVEDAVFATLRYPRDVIVNLHASWLSPRKIRDITVVGESRMLTFDDMNPSEPLRIYDRRVDDEARSGVVDTFASFRSSIREGDILIPRVSTGEPLKAECEDFVDAIASGKKPVSEARGGVAVVRVLSAIDRSMRNGGREERV